MPIYEYACPSCGREFEELIRGDEKPACPNCGDVHVQRQMSVLAAHMANSDGSACPSRDDCAMAHRCSGSCGHAH
jgi:putative FmdB family regulatory protein